MDLTDDNMDISAPPLEVGKFYEAGGDVFRFWGKWKGVQGIITLWWDYNPRRRVSLGFRRVDFELSVRDVDYDGVEGGKASMKESVVSREVRVFLEERNFRDAQQLKEFLMSLKGAE